MADKPSSADTLMIGDGTEPIIDGEIVIRDVRGQLVRVGDTVAIAESVLRGRELIQLLTVCTVVRIRRVTKLGQNYWFPMAECADNSLGEEESRKPFNLRIVHEENVALLASADTSASTDATADADAAQEVTP